MHKVVTKDMGFVFNSEEANKDVTCNNKKKKKKNEEFIVKYC